jgi:hypothetical protein
MPMMAWLVSADKLSSADGLFVHGDHNPFSALIEVLKPMEISKKKGLQARSTTVIFLQK